MDSRIAIDSRSAMVYSTIIDLYISIYWIINRTMANNSSGTRWHLCRYWLLWRSWWRKNLRLHSNPWSASSCWRAKLHPTSLLLPQTPRDNCWTISARAISPISISISIWSLCTWANPTISILHLRSWNLAISTSTRDFSICPPNLLRL